MNLEFLSDAEIKDPQRAERPKKEFNPEGMKIRILKDGRVFPSQELVDKLDLEYRNSEAENLGNALDFFSSIPWSQYTIGKEGNQVVDPEKQVVFAAVVPRIQNGNRASKVTAFNNVTYGEDNLPKSSVMDQASRPSGQEILEILSETYGEPEMEEYVDVELLELPEGFKINSSMIHVPKKRRRKNGETDVYNGYEVRRDVKMYVVILNR